MFCHKFFYSEYFKIITYFNPVLGFGTNDYWWGDWDRNLYFSDLLKLFCSVNPAFYNHGPTGNYYVPGQSLGVWLPGAMVVCTCLRNYLDCTAASAATRR